MKARGVFHNSDEVRMFPGGTVIFSEGDRGEEMFGVVSGSVEISVGDRVIDTHGPDDVFGEMALVDSAPRMATATAVVDTQLAVISKRHFLFLVHETPMFALQVMSTMAERIRHQV